MKVEINGKFEISSEDLMLKKHGLGVGGAIQTYIDNECIKHMEKYTPFLTGFLSGPAILLHTVIGSGEINQVAPQARYLYNGVVFGPNYPIRNGKISFNEDDGPIEGWVSGKRKYPTGRKLQYNKSAHPLAGPFWFNRMKADYKNIILAGAQEIARRLSNG